jgi:hypothetical protein
MFCCCCSLDELFNSLPFNFLLGENEAQFTVSVRITWLPLRNTWAAPGTEQLTHNNPGYFLSPFPPVCGLHWFQVKSIIRLILEMTGKIAVLNFAVIGPNASAAPLQRTSRLYIQYHWFFSLSQLSLCWIISIKGTLSQLKMYSQRLLCAREGIPNL